MGVSQSSRRLTVLYRHQKESDKFLTPRIVAKIRHKFHSRSVASSEHSSFSIGGRKRSLSNSGRNRSHSCDEACSSDSECEAAFNSTCRSYLNRRPSVSSFDSESHEKKVTRAPSLSKSNFFYQKNHHYSD